MPRDQHVFGEKLFLCFSVAAFVLSAQFGGVNFARLRSCMCLQLLASCSIVIYCSSFNLGFKMVLAEVFGVHVDPRFDR